MTSLDGVSALLLPPNRPDVELDRTRAGDTARSERDVLGTTAGDRGPVLEEGAETATTVPPPTPRVTLCPLLGDSDNLRFADGITREEGVSRLVVVVVAVVAEVDL